MEILQSLICSVNGESHTHMERFGSKLRTLRQRRGMTQRDLAAALGYASQGYITEIEANRKRPTVEFVLKVADLFKVSTDQLLRDTLDLDDT